MAAFVLARFSFRFNLIMLLLFTAGNLLPPQVIITPLYRMFLEMPLPSWLAESGVFYDSYFGIIAIHVAFQMGFCTFVLSNYFKSLPPDLNEAAFVDGAVGVAAVLEHHHAARTATARSACRSAVHMDLQRLLLGPGAMVTGDKRPITSLQNLSGTFFRNNNLIAAGSLLTAIPTLIVFVVLQRQFVEG